MSQILLGILRMPPELFWADDPILRAQHDQARQDAADEITQSRARVSECHDLLDRAGVHRDDGTHPQLVQRVGMLVREVERWRAMVDALPKTADGELLVPGKEYWCLDTYGKAIPAGRVSLEAVLWDGRRPLYSSREAAEAAKGQG